ncbi:MAG: phosphate-starvation-inducible PsiE family protein [Burkholderiales bacterium]
MKAAVLIVALIAVARKVIVLEPKELPEGSLLGIAAITLALVRSYDLVRRSHREDGHPDPVGKG